MDLARHVEAFRRDLLAVAAVGGTAETDLVQRLAAALESAVRLRVLDVLGDAARDLEANLAATVEVRIEGDRPSLVVVEDEEPERAPDDEFSARITLRLPESLKRRIEEAASEEGVSVNSWLVRALDRSVDRLRSHRSPRRVSGFARS